MRQITKLTLAIMSVFALSVVVAASASAQQFHANKTGTLKGTALNTQTFNTGGGLNVECTKAATAGKVTSLLALSQLVIVTYTACTAAGTSVTITPAHYLINADDGGVKLDNTVTITSTVGACKVTVGPQALKGLTYTNSAGKIIEKSNVTGITSTSTGGICGESSSAGTYTGTNDVELEGGSLSWS